MNEQSFYELLSMVKPLIENQNTVLRESVSAEETLCITGVPQTPVIFITL